MHQPFVAGGYTNQQAQLRIKLPMRSPVRLYPGWGLPCFGLLGSCVGGVRVWVLAVHPLPVLS
jgi:hypothetical protein